MKVKVAEASGVVLDWLVGKCEGRDPHFYAGIVRATAHPDFPNSPRMFGPELHYSTDWAQGGPIKEREGIATRRSKGKWFAMLSDDLGDGERAQWCEFTFRNVARTASTSRRCRFTGDTELQAAMRCYTASKLGDEVEVPDELGGA